MIENCVEKIFYIFEPYLPEDWEQLLLHAQIKKDYFYMTFYLKEGGKYVPCYEFFKNNGYELRLMKTFSDKLYEVCSREYTEDRIFTLTLNKNLEFRIDYHNDQDAVDIVKWEKDYLK